MNIIENTFKLREKRIRRIYEIEDNLYNELQNITLKYECNMSDLVNLALRQLIKSENVAIYKKPNNEILEKHSLLIDESNITRTTRIKYQIQCEYSETC